MDSKALRMGLEANRLFLAASALPASTAPGDVEYRQSLLNQAIDLRICEWREFSQSSEPCQKLGAAQAAQALGVYHAESQEYEQAGAWFERALEVCPSPTAWSKRSWYFTCFGDSLRCLVREQLARVQQLSAETPAATP
jgi:hypothetical protein